MPYRVGVRHLPAVNVIGDDKDTIAILVPPPCCAFRLDRREVWTVTAYEGLAGFDTGACGECQYGVEHQQRATTAPPRRTPAPPRAGV